MKETHVFPPGYNPPDHSYGILGTSFEEVRKLANWTTQNNFLLKAFRSKNEILNNNKRYASDDERNEIEKEQGNLKAAYEAVKDDKARALYRSWFMHKMNMAIRQIGSRDAFSPAPAIPKMTIAPPPVKLLSKKEIFEILKSDKNIQGVIDTVQMKPEMITDIAGKLFRRLTHHKPEHSEYYSSYRKLAELAFNLRPEAFDMRAVIALGVNNHLLDRHDPRFAQNIELLKKIYVKEPAYERCVDTACRRVDAVLPYIPARIEGVALKLILSREVQVNLLDSAKEVYYAPKPPGKKPQHMADATPKYQ